MGETIIHFLVVCVAVACFVTGALVIIAGLIWVCDKCVVYILQATKNYAFVMIAWRRLATDKVFKEQTVKKYARLKREQKRLHKVIEESEALDYDDE